MADIRYANGHTDGHNAAAAAAAVIMPRLHKQHSLRDGPGQLSHPLLHTLADHGNLSSAGSAGSTTSGSTANANANAMQRNCNGSGSGLEFDEHDIYYVSPSKRKGGGGGGVAPSYTAPRPAAAYENGSVGGGGASNVVTFSNYVSEQRAPSTRASTPSSCTIGTHNRGSLKRNKGRSNQSLCSCDAGDEADLKPDPTRPLYEYSLERRRKTHTYTCEQNAQILMRLERERNRKLSLTSVGAGSQSALAALPVEQQSDTPSLSDVDVIPPVPPPPAMVRNGSMRSLRLLQQLQHTGGSGSGSSNNNHVSGIAQLCSSDLLQDCTKTALDDCTTGILKCTNGLENNNLSKPDVCQPLAKTHATVQPSRKYLPPTCVTDDDIFMPHSKKSDPSLCFLQPAVPATSAASKYNTIGPSSDYARHLAHYSRYLQKQHQQQQLAHFQQQRCRCFSQSLASFPRDYFGTRSLADNQPSTAATATTTLATLQQLQLQPPRSSSGNNNNTINDNIFHTGALADAQDWYNGNGNGAAATLPINSCSFGNLVDIDGRHTLGSCRLPYHKFQHATGNGIIGSGTGSGSGSGGNVAAAASTFTMTSFDSANSSGLKEKQHFHEHHLHGHHQLHHQHKHHHHHHSQHQQQQQQHQQEQHAVGSANGSALGLSLGLGMGLGAGTPQKHHQLHSSVTSIMPWKHRQCPSRGSSSSGTNSFRFDAAKHWLAVSSILLIIGAASVAVPLALRVAASAPFEERLRVAVQLLDQVPLIDGHNDLPWNIRKFLHNKLNDFNFDEDLRNVMPWARSHWSHTDLTRLKKGRISAQFWAAYVPCEAQHRDAVQLTLEQIDVIKRLTDRYSPQLTTCTSAQDIIEAHKNQQLCSLTGVEGGHSLGGSLAVLRTLYAIGVRYMTLTSTCHTPWADSSYADAPTFNMKHGGLTIFGKTIIREMNRLGMMVDLSHVSKGTMRDALEVSEAPVIFSHSSAYELCNTSRNVQDDILQAVAKNGGLVMVNFYSKFLSCSDNSTVHDAVAHINHIKRVAGIDHVGLGAGYDGINYTPKGLEDVSSYPTLFAELLGGGWTMDELTKLAGGNFLRVMQQVEKLRDDKKAAGAKPYEDHPNFRTDDPYNCTSS